jgi:hypothetical protein
MKLWAGGLFRSGARSKGGGERSRNANRYNRTKMYFNLLVSKFNPHHSIHFLIILTLTYISNSFHFIYYRQLKKKTGERNMAAN